MTFELCTITWKIRWPGGSNEVPLPRLQAHFRLGGSRWAHIGSSSRPCSMTITTPTPSTACARCCENSWSHPRESCSMPPSLPGKFGERGRGLSICPCRHCPGLTLSPKLTLPGTQEHSFRRQMCWSGVVPQLCRTEGDTVKALELDVPGALAGWRNARAGLGNSWGKRGFSGNRSLITCNATKSQLSGELGVQNGPLA